MADDPTNDDDTLDEEPASPAGAADDDVSDAVSDQDGADDEAEPSASKAGAQTGPEATAAAAGGKRLDVGAKPVVRKKVASKRVTPKDPVPAGKQGSTAARTHGKDANTSSRYTPPTAKYADMPSPVWVPVLMFTLLIVGAFVIVGNYARLFGDPSNVVLVAGLGCILGGIITATNYR